MTRSGSTRNGSSPAARTRSRAISRSRPGPAGPSAAAVPVRSETMPTGEASAPACGRCTGCLQTARCIALVFHLPMPENLANSRMHWRAKHSKRQGYERFLSGLLYARQLPPVPVFPLTAATVYAELRLGNAMDDDNAVARCKWALDWIVKAGYLATTMPSRGASGPWTGS